MQNLTPNGNWKMAAIMGLDEEQVEDICKKVKVVFVVPANYNTIGQIVISGEEKAILKAEELAKKKRELKSKYIKNIRTIPYIEIRKMFRSIERRTTTNKYK